MQNPKLSIIVPVYNVEQYLSRCIDSILSQSFTDFELLLIDDGSTDGSGVICDEYAQMDSRVRVFHKENGGVSSARNVGLDNARGEWMYFIDSDDELMENSMKILVECISDEVDMVLAGFEEYYEDGNLKYSIPLRVKELLSPSESVLVCYEKYSRYYRYLGYLWIRLFRKDKIDNHRIRFDESIAVKEDTLFIVQYLCSCTGKTFFTTEPIYRYYRRESSVMTSLKGNWNEKYLTSFYAIQKMLYAIECSFPKEKKLITVAKEEELDRLNRIIKKQEKAGVEDLAMQKELYNQISADWGILFRIRHKMELFFCKIKKRIMQIIS